MLLFLLTGFIGCGGPPADTKPVKVTRTIPADSMPERPSNFGMEVEKLKEKAQKK